MKRVVSKRRGQADSFSRSVSAGDPVVIDATVLDMSEEQRQASTREQIAILRQQEQLDELHREHARSRVAMRTLAVLGIGLGAWTGTTGIEQMSGAVEESGAGPMTFAVAAERFDTVASFVMASADKVDAGERFTDRTPEQRRKISLGIRAATLTAICATQGPALYGLGMELAHGEFPAAAPAAIAVMGVNAAFGAAAVSVMKPYAKRFGEGSAAYNVWNHYRGDRDAAVLMGVGAAIGLINHPVAHGVLWAASVAASGRVIKANMPFGKNLQPSTDGEGHEPAISTAVLPLDIHGRPLTTDEKA